MLTFMNFWAATILRSCRCAKLALRLYPFISAVGFTVSPLQGSVSTVSNLNDSGSGSLRYLIANAAPGDTIIFSVTGTISLTSGELLITNDVTIAGPGADKLAVSSNGRSRVIQIGSTALVHISNLTISDGQAPAGRYGYPYCDYLAAMGGNGGSILNAGRLTLLQCAFTNSHAGAGSQFHCAAGDWAGQGGSGGAIFNANLLAVTACTFSGNSAGRGANGGTYRDEKGNNHPTLGANGGSGGGIFNWGILSLTNCTLLPTPLEQGVTEIRPRTTITVGCSRKVLPVAVEATGGPSSTMAK